MKEFDELKKKDAEDDADDEAEEEEEGDQLAPLQMETRGKGKRRRNNQGLPMASKGPTTPKKRNKQGDTDDTPSSNTRSRSSKPRRSARGKK